jgi:hypothetical protein
MKLRALTSFFLLALASACGVVSGDNGDGDGDGDDLDAGAEIDAGLDLDAPGVRVAPDDNDTLEEPAESHFLSITGEREFTYSDEISSPEGDDLDFIEFEFPNNSNTAQVVRITLDCAFEGDLEAVGAARILEDGEAGTLRVQCNEGEQTLTVNNTKVQTARVEITTAAGPTHLEYTLTVVGFQ